MTDTKYIVERRLIGVTPEGEKEIFLRLGAPYQVDDRTWRCPSDLTGLYKRLADATGSDSMHALFLAISLLRSLLEDFVEKGNQLFDEFENERDTFEIEKAFSTHFGKKE